MLVTDSAAGLRASSLSNNETTDEPLYQRRRLPYRLVGPYSVAYLGHRPSYFNETGTLLLQELAIPRTKRQLADTIMRRFGLPNTTYKNVAESVQSFVSQGLSAGIVSLHGGQQLPQASSEQHPTSSETNTLSPFTGEGCATLTAEQAIDKPVSIESTIAAYSWKQRLIRKVHIELTYRCNYKCVHCYNPHHAGFESELSLTQWISILQQLAQRGCSLITFTGGELFVRKDIAEILHTAAELGFTMRLNTNASLLNAEKLAGLETIRPFLQSFDISFYGADAESHDAVSKREGSYAKTLDAALLLQAQGWPMVAKFITLQSNFLGLKKWEADMQQLGIPHIVHTGSLIPRTDRSTGPLVQLLTDQQYTLMIEDRGHPNGQEKPGDCKPGFVRGAITPEGKVAPCEWLTDISFGSLLDHDLDSIWMGQKALEFRSIFDRPSECTPCSLRGNCSRCPAHSYLETGSIQGCAPIQRHNAEIYTSSMHS